MRRSLLLALALLLLTLAPRTSNLLTNDWEYVSRNPSYEARGGTTTFVATVWQSTSTVTHDQVIVTVQGVRSWSLVGAPAGCVVTAQPVPGVLCDVDLSGPRHQQVVRVTVSSAAGQPLLQLARPADLGAGQPEP